MIRSELKGDALYYEVARVLSQKLAKRNGAILDVGSGGHPALEWFPEAAVRVSVDRRKPYDAPGVLPVTDGFFDWKAEQVFDLALCLQVLQQITNAQKAAQKLLRIARIVVVSVPYKWKEGERGAAQHYNIDEEMMLEWFGREPNFQYLCREIASDAPRLIHVYERNAMIWSTLSERTRLRADRQAADEGAPAEV